MCLQALGGDQRIAGAGQGSQYRKSMKKGRQEKRKVDENERVIKVRGEKRTTAEDLCGKQRRGIEHLPSRRAGQIG